MSTNNQEETQPVQVPGPDLNPEENERNENTVPLNVSQTDPDETMPIRTEALHDSTGWNDPEPVPVEPAAQGGKKGSRGGKKPKRKRSGRLLWVFLGLLLVIILGGVGSVIGYYDGLNKRLDQEYSQIAMAAVTQFQLALEDESAGRFEMAIKRYQYVIQLDPNFPGARERLTEVMLHQAETAVPTAIPTETPIPVTPTPDMRGIEEKYENASALLRAQDWDNAIAVAELVRKEDVGYRAADIDGIFYIALRFRGIQKILGGNLEPGIYDLTLSEGFAPLDKDAEGYRTWARYYLTGSSFWDVDWASVVRIFGDIYPSLPNLRDGSGWTAQERYRIGCINYADQLAESGQYCDAQYYYQQALSIAGDERVFPTATAIHLLCEPPTATPTQTSEVLPTVESTPVPENTPEPAPTETQDLTSLCCPPADPENPDPLCGSYTCPGG